LHYEAHLQQCRIQKFIPGAGGVKRREIGSIRFGLENGEIKMIERECGRVK